MNEMQASEYVKLDKSEVVTTSRIMAEKFKKRHADVVRVIRILDKKVGVCNFTPTLYSDIQGKNQIEYTMDRKAYMLLAMRFTGDEALKTQIAFIDAFEMMIKLTTANFFTQNDKVKAIPEAAQTFKSLTAVGETFGLEKNQALLYANKATKREMGIDFQEMLQIELKNPQQSRPLTPTELGNHFNLSAQQINKRLADCGLQIKKNNVWNATEKGKTHSVLLDVGKKASDGTPVTQLKWYESILPIINLK